jgi:hypothetical protein
MFRRRSFFPFDRVLAESLEPRVLYSASPVGMEFAPPADSSDGRAETLHIAYAWTSFESSGIDPAAQSEHHLSHMLDQAGAGGDEWSLWKRS